MKTLIVYDKKSGNVSFTQSIASAEDRTVARVENGEVINDDIYIKR